MLDVPANLPVPSGGFAESVDLERTSPFRSGGFAAGRVRWHRRIAIVVGRQLVYFSDDLIYIFY